ncbi:FBXL2-like protein [Mya arenaria]|uniref:FBXL2-like protein n=1 Tax=Mya arenaria TaxID=6604 RepID=A0ABY7FJG1_MYAAR|nr:FBXL2-like protein [Mya arenaria]
MVNVMASGKRNHDDSTLYHAQQSERETCTIDSLPDKCLQHAFSFLHQRELGKIARVCKKWRLMAYSNQLWQVVSLRPEYNGSFENSSEGDEDVYEVVNIGKIKSHTPNLRVVNMYGITFIDDSHIELLTSNCIHLECLALNFCLRVKGSSFKTLVQRCKKLKTLLLHHTGVEDEYMVAVPWETAQVHELDLTSTELSTECLENVLLRIPFFTFLGLGHCEFFTDKILGDMVAKGKFRQLRAIDISSTPALSENTIYQICVLGTANGWFLKLTTKVHIDQVIEGFAQYCPYLLRLEIQWDPDTIRFSDKSSKFVDHIRLKCPFLKSFTLSDGEYYEMVKSNFERADRVKVVRTTTFYTTSIISLVSCYNDLLFN